MLVLIVAIVALWLAVLALWVFLLLRRPRLQHPKPPEPKDRGNGQPNHRRAA
jgi:hypothetical protein